MTTLLLLGLLMGMRHALDADHIAAVATLVSDTKCLSQAIVQGAIWGLGHTVTLTLVMILALSSGFQFSAHTATLLEGLVGVMLILLALDVARRLRRNRLHAHVHQHGDGQTHVHFHVHQSPVTSDHQSTPHQHAHYRHFQLRALTVGLVHGLAGSALLTVFALERLETIWHGLLYVVIFGVGSIIGMSILSALIAYPFTKAKTAGWFDTGFQTAIIAVNLGLGTLLIARAIA